MPKHPFRDLKLAAKEGRTLTPEDLSSKDLSTTILETVAPDIEFRVLVEKNIEDAIRVGVDIAKILDDVKPMARVMITKALYEHTLQVDRKMVQLIKKSGLWESI
jgi:hypothetical protein